MSPYGHKVMTTGIVRRAAFGGSSIALLFAPVAPATAGQTSTTRDARVVGKVVSADGAPEPGVSMNIVKTDTGVFPGPSRTIDRLTTGRDGTYSGVLPGAYIEGRETDADWIVTASRPARGAQAAGPSSSFELEVNTPVQEAPDLPLWDSTPLVSIDGYRVGVSVPAGPPRGTNPQVVLGQLSEPGTAGAFDLRAFEPGKGDGRASTGLTAGGSAAADITVRHIHGRTIYHQRLRTPTVAVNEPSLVPFSRGAPCKVTATDGRVTAVQPCPATDGDLSSSLRPPGQPTTNGPARTTSGETTTTVAQVASVTVELAAPGEVESVFLRQCDRSCVVEVSRDGSTWAKPRSVESGNSYQGAVLIARFQPVTGARLVRVSRPGGALTVAEISAWPARPPGSPARSVPEPSTDPIPQPTATILADEVAAAPVAPTSGAARAVGPVWLAAFLVVAVGAGLVTRSVRRRPIYGRAGVSNL